jgi:hypothetical protein
MLRLERARDANQFRRRNTAPPVWSVNDARKQALSLVLASRAPGGGGGGAPAPDPRMTVQRLAAHVLIALPGGPWWTVHGRFGKHLQAAMTSERIGASHLRVSAVRAALGALGIEVSVDDLAGIAKELEAWHKDKGILVSAFVDGILAAGKVIGIETKMMTISPTPSEKMAHWARGCEQADASDGDLRSARSEKTVSFPYYDSAGAPVAGELEKVMIFNSPGRLSHQDLQELSSPAAAKIGAGEQLARAKDWRMDNRLQIRDAEKRHNPAVTKTWQTIQMPTGVWFHTEQLGHHDPAPPSRLSTPRIDLDGTGYLTNSELMVLRSLKKNMPADQPFSQMNSFQRLAVPMPRHKPLASALSTSSKKRHAHLVPELAIPHMDTGHRLDPGSQTERAMRATKPHYTPTVPLLTRGSFRPHPSWAPTGADG